MALRMILGRLAVGVRALQNPTIRASMASMASNAVVQNGGIPPLSDMIQAEFDFDKTSTIWKELLVLARQVTYGTPFHHFAFCMKGFVYQKRCSSDAL